jgi:hypothetical protein
MSRPIKPSIVFCHGIWADGSCFSKVIPVLQAEGHEVMAVQYGLDTFTVDVAAIKRTLGRVSSPAILVGHSHGGATTSQSRMDASGYLRRKAPSVSRETFPNRSRRSCGRPTTRPPPIYLSNKSSSPMTSLGSRKRAGTSWPRLTAPCIQTSSVSWQSAWGRPLFETNSSHVIMLSQPDLVVDVIRKAASGVLSKAA